MELIFITNQMCFEHEPGGEHPERPDRLSAVLSGFQRAQLDSIVTELIAQPVDEELVLRVHDQELVHKIKETSVNGGGVIDVDTRTSSASWRAALIAAGAGLQAVSELQKGKATAAFCAIRPPGHHATISKSMGFCLLNNVAVTAKQLKEQGEKVLIVDYDAHHGNGTQDVFYSDPDVLFISFHQMPLYPGTGSVKEIGEGDGIGATINIPLPPRTTGDVFLSAWDQIALPAIEEFSPTWLLISAGFDAHRRDPLTDLGLTAGDYNLLTSQIIQTVPAGRRLVFLEGGYDLLALELSTHAVLHALIGEQTYPEELSNGGIGIEAVNEIKSALLTNEF